MNIETIQLELCLQYKCLQKGKSKETFGVDKQKALYAGCFRGHYHKCRKQGHKATDCQSKKLYNSSDSNQGANNECTNYWYCKKYSHTIDKCQKLKTKNNNNQSYLEQARMAHHFFCNCCSNKEIIIMAI